MNQDYFTERVNYRIKKKQSGSNGLLFQWYQEAGGCLRGT